MPPQFNSTIILDEVAPGKVLIPGNGKDAARLLECRLVDGSVPKEDISDFVTALNGAWRNFFPVDEDLMRRRLANKPFFVAAYEDGLPITILETKGFRVDQRELDIIGELFPGNDVECAKLRAYEVCRKLPGNYAALTAQGTWDNEGFRGEKKPNVLVMVDITAHPGRKGAGAAAIIQYLQTMWLENRGFRRPDFLSDVKYGVTFTPADDPLAAKLHTSNGAFDTGYRQAGARPGHMNPDVNFFCYLAPGYTPVPQRTLTVMRKA